MFGWTLRVFPPKGPLVQRGLSAKLTGGLSRLRGKSVYIFARDNPSAPSGHLPLHKGGFVACSLHPALLLAEDAAAVVLAVEAVLGT